MHFFKHLCNRRLFVILCQGFASGLPLALVGSTLQTWFAISGVDVITIGALTLVGQPYVYKFLWAPLLDRYSFSILGRRRGWMFITQLFLAGCILLFSYFDPINHTLTLAALALVTACISATQDIAIDAYRTEIFTAPERGLGISFYTGGYRLAILVSSSGALIFADHIGWEIMYQIIAAIMLLAALVTLLVAPEPERHHEAPTTLRKAIIGPLHELWARRGIVAVLVFILLYKLTNVVTLPLGSKFLIDLGFSLTEIGAIYKGAGLVATLAGALCGGLLMLRVSLFTALLWFGILQALSNLTFAWLALVGKNITILTIAVFSENFCSGLTTVAFMAFLMHLCNKRYTATQYALLSSIAIIGHAYIGPFVGWFASSLPLATNPSSWSTFYVGAFMIALPSFMMLYYLKHKKVFEPIFTQP